MNDDHDSMAEVRGHLIVEDGKYWWKYEDTGERYNPENDRPCKHCGKPPTKEGHDPCLGELRGIMFACCGHHGSIQPPYVTLNDGTYIRFNSRKELFDYFGMEYID